MKCSTIFLHADSSTIVLHDVLTALWLCVRRCFIADFFLELSSGFSETISNRTFEFAESLAQHWCLIAATVPIILGGWMGTKSRNFSVIDVLIHCIANTQPVTFGTPVPDDTSLQVKHRYNLKGAVHFRMIEFKNILLIANNVGQWCIHMVRPLKLIVGHTSLAHQLESFLMHLQLAHNDCDNHRHDDQNFWPTSRKYSCTL